MKKNYKKIILFLIFIILLLFLAYYINIAKNCNNTVAYYKNIATPPQNNKVSEEKWSTYHDGKYGFSINYQSGVNINTLYNFSINFLKNDIKKNYTINGGVDFSSFNPGTSIQIFDNSPFSSLEEWFNDQNTENPSSRYVITSKQPIDGYPAISIYATGDSKETSKITAFLRNKQLFVIITGDDSNFNNIFDSFKFDK